jgi:UPF0755 protein
MLDDLDLAWEEQQEPGHRRRGQPPSRQMRRRRRTERKRRRRSFGALFVSMLLLGALGFGTWWGVGKIQEFFGAADYSHTGTEIVSIEVKSGDTATDIGNTLYDAGVVKSAKAFVIAAKENPLSANIQPGHYQLYRQMPAAQALAVLLDPENNRIVNRVTIAEGKTVKEAFALLSQSTGIPVKDFEAAAKNPEALGSPDFWFNRNNEDGRTPVKSLEGFLFPDTYGFPPNADATTILKQMVARFFEVADEVKFVETAESKGVTPFEALTVASLVEREAGVHEDMPKVSRVVYNRLQPAWQNVDCGCLAFDATTNYWRQLQGLPVKPSSQMTLAELRDPKNVYNTSVKPGLPPGPIANPGRVALEAAINPAQGPWLYFVLIDKEGRSAFAVTFAEHQANIAKAKQNGVG